MFIQISGDMLIRKASRILFCRSVRDIPSLSIALIQAHRPTAMVNETTCRVGDKAQVKVS